MTTVFRVIHAAGIARSLPEAAALAAARRPREDYVRMGRISGERKRRLCALAREKEAEDESQL